MNRWFQLMKRRFDLSVQGTNIFNGHLVYRVDPVTGRGYEWGKGAFDPNTVHRVLRLVRGAEFKRKQAAPGLKVTDRAFGTGWRMPIAARVEP